MRTSPASDTPDPSLAYPRTLSVPPNMAGPSRLDPPYCEVPPRTDKASRIHADALKDVPPVTPQEPPKEQLADTASAEFMETDSKKFDSPATSRVEVTSMIPATPRSLPNEAHWETDKESINLADDSITKCSPLSKTSFPTLRLPRTSQSRCTDSDPSTVAEDPP